MFTRRLNWSPQRTRENKSIRVVKYSIVWKDSYPLQSALLFICNQIIIQAAILVVSQGVRTMPFIPKKSVFAVFVFLDFSRGQRCSRSTGTHNVSDKALLNVCLQSLTCWDKFHITASTPGEKVIRGPELPHTNKRSACLCVSFGRHKASVWK